MRRLLLLALFLPGLALGQTAVKLYTTDTVQSACSLGAANATCQVTMAGKSTAGFLVTAISSPSGITLVAESSRDGTNWDGHPMQDASTGERITSVPNASIAVGYGKSIVLGAGDRFVRIRASAWTSGSATVVVTATDTPMPQPWPVDATWYTTGLVTATTLTQMIAAPASGLSIYVTSIVASASVAATTTTDQQLVLKYGTGSNCGTGTTYLIGAFNAANGGFAWTAHPGNSLKLPAANALCFIKAATGSAIFTVTYYVAG